MGMNSIGSGARVVCVLMALLLCSAATSFASAGDPPMDPPSHHTGDAGPQHEKHGSMGSVGAKLADPTSDLWAIQMNFEGPKFSDGDVNDGDPKVGGDMVIQPILPIPLYGTGADEWKVITRPVIPIVFGTPIPRGDDVFYTAGGIGDIELEMLLAAPASFTRLPKNLIFAAGLGLEFPTSTRDELGAQQYAAGPAVALGWKTSKYTALIFPTYFFSIGDRSDRKSSTPDTSKLSLIYEFIYNLPNAWQVGLNPVITYNRNPQSGKSGDKWNVPVGLFGSKTMMVAGTPLNIKAGIEYSVVSEDTFGKRAMFRFQITPIIPSLISKPIFGGG
jgi:hypothetical protein